MCRYGSHTHTHYNTTLTSLERKISVLHTATIIFYCAILGLAFSFPSPSFSSFLFFLNIHISQFPSHSLPLSLSYIHTFTRSLTHAHSLIIQNISIIPLSVSKNITPIFRIKLQSVAPYALHFSFFSRQSNMRFDDREDAAKRLGAALLAQDKYTNDPNGVVVALPRGGVPMGRIVADMLGLPLDIVVPRKLGHPFNSEYAIGAVTETGQVVWNEGERRMCDQHELERIVEKQRAEAERRVHVFRPGMPPRNFRDKTVIVVDDGAATGYTMDAALRSLRAMHAGKIIVALPVAPPDTVVKLSRHADDMLVLSQPVPFYAVGQFYRDFPQVEDEEVIAIMKGAQKK